jgi:hypothetical protein
MFDTVGANFTEIVGCPPWLGPLGWVCAIDPVKLNVEDRVHLDVFGNPEGDRVYMQQCGGFERVYGLPWVNNCYQS